MQCLVKNCKNECTLPRDFCNPCHDYITKGEGTRNQAYRNAISAGILYFYTYLLENLLKDFLLRLYE